MNDKKLILVIEDEEPLRNALTDKLEKVGFAVTSADNGENGLAEVQKQRPDLILLDMLMPVMGGLTVMQRLNELARDPMIPIIVLSNQSGITDVANVLGEGGRDYLVKSDWKIADIIKKVQDRLNPPTLD